jgi:hypothetical protein
MEPIKPPEPTGLLANAAAAAPAAPQTAANFDFAKQAGETAKPTAWTPSDNAMASNQLTKLLSEDSKYMQMARAGATRTAASRGLLNSSIAAGAGEAAAIQSALPIAQQDAQTWGNSEQFNAGQTNEFARDGNLFQRQGVLAKFNAANEAEQRGLDRQQQTDLQRDDQSFRAGQATLDRAQQETMTRLSAQLQTDFERFKLPMNMMAESSARMQEYVGKIMSDPNLTPESKDAAIENYYKYQQSQFGWMSNFFNSSMPNIMGGPSIQPTFPNGGVAQGPAQGPSIPQPTVGVPVGGDVGVPRPRNEPVAPIYQTTGVNAGQRDFAAEDAELRYQGWTGDQYERFNRPVVQR